MLRALRYRNYRLFFGGQIVSLAGTWITMTATSWLVYRLTGSAVLLGIADSLVELKGVCDCGRKATMNLRVGADGKAVKAGAQTEVPSPGEPMKVDDGVGVHEHEPLRIQRRADSVRRIDHHREPL